MRNLLAKFFPVQRTNPYPPVVIGATGGSGTRAMRGVMEQAGLFMGVRLNGAGDALDMVPFLDGYVNRLLRATGTVSFELQNLPQELKEEALGDFEKCLRTYQGELPPYQRWGWKNPRSMYILPLILHFFPRMQFIHVVRDGRDMALSPNQNQLLNHYEALFGHKPRGEMDPAESARLWATANSQVAEWGEAKLGERYLRIRFEDLCEDPIATADTIIERFELPNKNGAQASRNVERPATIGRWKDAEAAVVERIMSIAGPTLEKLGYV